MLLMLVCSNTSPLSNLAVIGRLSLLWNQYSFVTIPSAVWSELLAFGHDEVRSAIEDARAVGRIRVENVQNRDLVRLLNESLDAGESEAIALAIEKHADLLLMDETDGRSRAKLLGLKHTGILGILLDARNKGEISSLQFEIARLRKEAHFFISPALESSLLRLVGEAS